MREKLSEYAHDAWSGWMKYLFSKSTQNEDGTVTIPKWAVERWTRQSETGYTDLPEDEKRSDREEADRMIDIMHKQKNGVSEFGIECNNRINDLQKYCTKGILENSRVLVDEIIKVLSETQQIIDLPIMGVDEAEENLVFEWHGQIRDMVIHVNEEIWEYTSVWRNGEGKLNMAEGELKKGGEGVKELINIMNGKNDESI